MGVYRLQSSMSNLAVGGLLFLDIRSPPIDLPLYTINLFGSRQAWCCWVILADGSYRGYRYSAYCDRLFDALYWAALNWA